MSGGNKSAGTPVSTCWMGIGCRQDQMNVDISAATWGIWVSQLCTTETNDPEGYFGRKKIDNYLTLTELGTSRHIQRKTELMLNK